MVRIIPRRTKVKLEFMKGVTGIDLLIGVVAAVVLILLAASNFDGHVWIAMVWAIFSISLFFKIADSDRFYVTIIHLARFSMQKKKYEKKYKGVLPTQQIEQRFAERVEHYKRFQADSGYSLQSV